MDVRKFYGDALDRGDLTPNEIRRLITMDPHPDRYEKLDLLAEVLEERRGDRKEFIDAVASRQNVAPHSIRNMLAAYKRHGLKGVIRKWL